MFKFKGRVYEYEINDLEMLVIREEGLFGMVNVSEQLVKNYTVLNFSINENGSFLDKMKRGTIVLTTPRGKNIATNIYEEEVDNYKELFKILTQQYNCDFMGMDYFSASMYRPDDDTNKNSGIVVKKEDEEKKALMKKGKFVHKKVKEDKYICTKCGHIWYISETDIKAEQAVRVGGLCSLFAGQWSGAILSNKTKSVFKCPVCNSERIKKIKG